MSLTGNTSGKTNNALFIKITKLKMLDTQLTSTKRATLFYSSEEQRTSMKLHTKVHSVHLRYMIMVQFALEQVLSKTPSTSEGKSLRPLHPSRQIPMTMGENAVCRLLKLGGLPEGSLTGPNTGPARLDRCTYCPT